MPKFKSATGSTVTVMAPDVPRPIRLSHLKSKAYHTTDEAEVRALRASDEVEEVRESSKD